MIPILLLFLACIALYCLWLWLHNNLAEQMIKTKDTMILNLQQEIRMQNNTIDKLRDRNRMYRQEIRRLRKLSTEGIKILK